MDLKLSNINQRLIFRLLAVWVLLSLIIGLLVYKLEIREIDQYVLELVLQDAKTFDPALVDRINSPDEGVGLRFQEKVNDLLERHYSLVDIYDLNQAHVATAERKLKDDIRAIIEPRHHIFPLDKQLHFEKIEINEALFLQVLVPLKNSANETSGYMEGVYHVEAEVLSSIQWRIYRILFLVVITLLSCTIALYPIITHLNRRLIRFSKNLLHANLQLMNVLGNAVAVRDQDTNSHNYRVTLYAVRIGEKMGLAYDDMRSLIAGSFLHDVGKIGIRDAVLQKPQSLSKEETEHMQEHVAIGMNVIGDVPWLSGASHVIEFHHEKFDGSGYLLGLKGDEIPLVARIFAVADVFDALTTKRAYKDAYSFEEAMRQVEGQKGGHFDPDVVGVFQTIADQSYREFIQADNKALEKLLTACIDHYFFDEQLL